MASHPAVRQTAGDGWRLYGAPAGRRLRRAGRPRISGGLRPLRRARPVPWWYGRPGLGRLCAFPPATSPVKLSPPERRAAAALALVVGLRMFGLFLVLPV